MKKQWTTVLDFIQHGKVTSKYQIVEVQGMNTVGDGGAVTLVRTGAVGTPSQSFLDTGNNTCVDKNGDVWGLQEGTVATYNGTDNWFGNGFGLQNAGNYELKSGMWGQAETKVSKGEYTPDITLVDESQYITYNGKPYYAINPPYTTTAVTPDTDGNLYVGDPITQRSLASYATITYKAGRGNSAVENMLSDLNLNPLMYAVGTYIKTGGTTFEYTDSTGAITLNNFRAFNSFCVLDFMKDTDTDINTPAQRAVDYITSKDRNVYGATLYFPANTYTITNAIQMYECDGIVIAGDGKYATVFEVSPSYALSLNQTFTDLNGQGSRGYTYDENSVFMVAASRRLGDADGKDGDTGRGLANSTAQWGLTFKDFRVKGHSESTPLDSYTLTGIYAPSIAHTHMSDIEFQYCFSGIYTNDMYRVLLESMDFRNCYHIINHTTIGTNGPNGTSLTAINCGASRVRFGWKFFGMSYSNLISCTVDDWGYQLTSGDTPYAYDMDTCLGMGLIGCGGENTLFSDSAVVVIKCLRASGTETLEINNMNMKVFNYDNSTNQSMYDIDGTYVSFEGCALSGGDGSTKYITITGFSRVDFKNNYQSLGVIWAERIYSDQFSNIEFDSSNSPYSICYAGSSDVPLVSGSNILTFAATETNSAWGNTSGIDNGDMASTYEIDFSGSFEGAGLRWVELKIGSTNSNVVRVYADDAKTGIQPISVSARRTIQPNQTVRIEAVTNTGSVELKAGSTFKVVRVAGRVS